MPLPLVETGYAGGGESLIAEQLLVGSEGEDREQRCRSLDERVEKGPMGSVSCVGAWLKWVYVGSRKLRYVFEAQLAWQVSGCSYSSRVILVAVL